MFLSKHEIQNLNSSIFFRIVDSTADLASKLHQPEGGTFSSIKSQSVGIAAIRPPAEGQNETDGEVVASFSDTGLKHDVFFCDLVFITVPCDTNSS